MSSVGVSSISPFAFWFQANTVTSKRSVSSLLLVSVRSALFDLPANTIWIGLTSNVLPRTTSAWMRPRPRQHPRSSPRTFCSECTFLALPG
jgi:hypothetical protein